MSRATSQLTVPSRHIFITPIKQSDGTIKSVMSSKPLSDQSVRVNRAWQGEQWVGNEEYEPGKYRKKYVSGKCSNSGALFLLATVWFHPVLFDKKNKKQFLCSDVLQYIVGTFILGVNFATAENISQYAIAISGRWGQLTPTSHRTVRTVPYTALQERCTHLFTSNQ